MNAMPMTPTMGTRRSRPDYELAREAAAVFLDALGVDYGSEGVTDTPARMARAYIELLTSEAFDLTTFPNEPVYEQLVVQRAIPFTSLCEHHFLPFTGLAYVGYLPGDRLLGLSKLARVVEVFACRPQLQERLTQQVADWLCEQLNPRGVGVLVHAEHLCVTMRGVRAAGTSTVTSALCGLLRSDPRWRDEFYGHTGVAG